MKNINKSQENTVDKQVYCFIWKNYENKSSHFGYRWSNYYKWLLFFGAFAKVLFKSQRGYARICNGEFRETSIGKKDLKEILKLRLENWNWKLGVEKILDLWFLSEAKTDKQVLDLTSVLQEKGITCCIASNQEKYRKQFLLDDMGFEKLFDRTYFSCDFGVAKPSPEYYKKIISDLKLQPEEILVIDDDNKNIETAKSLGIHGFQYTHFISLMQDNNFLDILGIIKTAGVAIFDENKEKVLLVKHGTKAGHIDGTYGLPAGRLDESENYLEAAVRECREETGLEVLVEDLVSNEQYFSANILRSSGKIKTFTGRFFLVKKFSGELLGNEETVPEWIEISKLGEINLFGNQREIIDFFIK